jgi:hypothetical protein
VTVEEAVVERLLALSSVTALVSTRVYQLRLPQRPTLPAVRVQQISESEPYHLRGAVNLYRTRIQVDAYAAEASGSDPYASANAVASAIQGDWLAGSPPNGLSGWQGMAGGSPSTLQVVFSERIDRRPMFAADELRLVRVRQDYMVTWKAL